MDIVASLAAATQGLQILKALREIDKGVDAAEWKAKLAEVQVALSDAKMALQEAKEEIAAKDKEIERVTGALKRREEAVQSGNFLYPKGPDGNPSGQPFCPVCLQKEGLFINLARVAGRDGMTNACPKCKGDFGFRLR